MSLMISTLRPLTQPQPGNGKSACLGLVHKNNMADEPERGDEQEYIGDVDASRMMLTYMDTCHKDSLLARLNTLRRNRSLCDVVILVENREIFAHRCVLAAFSPTMCEMLTRKAHSPKDSHENGVMDSLTNDIGVMGVSWNENGRPTYLEFPNINFDCFDALINYAYTSCLEIECGRVTELYKAACYLKCQQCASICADYLIANITPQNAVGIRKSANRTSDSLLCSAVDSYITEQFVDICVRSKEFSVLPCCQVEIIGPVDPYLRGKYLKLKENTSALGEKVLEYLQKMEIPNHMDVRPEYLTSHPHILVVGEDFDLQDCCDCEDTGVSTYAMVQDYRKQNPRVQTANINNKARSNSGSSNSDITSMTSPARGMLARYSSTESMASSICSNCDIDDVPWKLIAITKSTGTDKFWLALAVVHRYLMALSIQLIDHPPCQSVQEELPPVIISHYNDVTLLAPMTTPRCASGAVNLKGKLVVFGGYVRGEVLRAAAEYDCETNEWTDLAPMKEARGRLDASVCMDKIYAVGGSDGNNDLASAEVYDPDTKTWSSLPPLLLARSNVGCTSVGNVVYCIGGWDGRTAVRQCERLNPNNAGWQTIPPLTEGRYQSGCVSLNGKIVVVGGCGAWSCLNTVECFDPNTQVWSPMSSLTHPRRGCGAAFHNGKLWAVGGSDGQSSLMSTEVLDIGTGVWLPGPPMTCPRANVRAVSVNGRLYAIGGFSGKTFLPTIECLNQDSTKWITCCAE